MGNGLPALQSGFFLIGRPQRGGAGPMFRRHFIAARIKLPGSSRPFQMALPGNSLRPKRVMTKPGSVSMP